MEGIKGRSSSSRRARCSDCLFFPNRPPRSDSFPARFLALREQHHRRSRTGRTQKTSLGPLAGVQSSARPRAKPEPTRNNLEKSCRPQRRWRRLLLSIGFSQLTSSLSLVIFHLKKSLRQYDAKLCKLLDTYDKAFLVHADNVGSRQFMDIRRVRDFEFAKFSQRDQPSIELGAVFFYSPLFLFAHRAPPMPMRCVIIGRDL